MNSKTIRAKYLKFAILIISVSFILGAISACLPFNVSIPELNDNAISDTEVIITQNTSDGLGEFNDGYSYVYTDKNKVDGYRAGREDYDMTSHKVAKTSGNRGSEDNPYVITNVTQWNSFASSATSASTTGKVYVLGQDIDFDGESFSAVENFNGKFYGIGHTLSNINKNFGNLNTCGIFREIGTESVVADLNLDNVTLTTSGYEIGMLAGSSGGSVLNCHVKGYITGVSSIVGNEPSWTQYAVGGLVGDAKGNNIKIYIYRCSVNVKAVVSTAGGSSGGGIIGSYNSSGGLSVAIYDCVAITDFTVSTSDGLWFGGITNYCNSVGEQAIENCAVYSKITCGSQGRLLYAALTNGYPTALPKLTLKNIYCSATLVYNGSTTYNIPPALFYDSWTAPVVNKMTLDCDNINWFADKTLYFSGASDFLDRRSIANKKYTGATGLTQNDMYENLKSVMPSDIWAQKDVIDTSYMTNTDVASTSGYTIDNSPVRNFLAANVTFKNLLSGGGEEGLGIATAEYRAGDALPSPSGSYLKDNHTFRGWTMDKTGKSDPINALPTGVFGDVTLYAVWGLPDSYVNSNIKTSLSADKNTIEYDSVASITLTAKVTHTAPSSGAMTNPSVIYYWKQTTAEGTVDKANNTTGELNLKLVKDSGDYTYAYRIKDDLEPLWYYDGDYSGNAETLTIEKGKLEHMTIKDFKISSSTVPYYGKELGDVDFTVKMYNNANKEVELSTETPYKWQMDIDKVTPGTNDDKKIVIYPADTDNYETSYEFLVEFEAQALVIVFHMEQISKEIEVEVEYGQNYGANEIIYLFEQAYLKALSTWDSATIRVVESKAPYLDGKALVEGDANANKFDTEYNGINEIHTIEVTFKDASYEVVFNPNNGVAGGTTQETYKYGQFLKKPTDPVNGDLLFVGWYFDEDYIDENGNQATRNRAWRFNSVGDVPQDRVTKAVELIAKWLKADTLDSIKVEVDPSKKYMAQTSLQEGDLIVTATYSGQVDGQSIEQEVVLSWSDFASKITYSTIDKQLHVTDGGYEVTVSFTYGSTTKTDSILINVLPISVDTSKLIFADKTIVYDGTDTNVTIEPIKGTLPNEITNVKYVYTKNGQEVDESTVKGVGTWIVQAVFETDSADYYAEPMLATLKVVRPTALEKPTFKGGVTYDGTEKNIEDYLDGYNSEYMQIVGDVTGTAVGRYTITIQLTDGSWSDGTAGNVTLNWTIDKATLIPKWDNWEFIASDTSNGFAPVISSIAQGLASGDSVDYATDFIYKIYDEEDNELSESEVSEVGSYKIVASINASSALYKNYQFDGASNEWSFVVVPQAGMEILTIEWSDTEFLYDGEKHIPTYVVKDRNGNVVENATQILNFSNYEKKTEIATYTIKVTVKDSDRYFIRSGAICKFKIVEELGDEPPAEDEDPTTPPSGEKPSGGIGSIEDIIKYFKEYPLWQIIAGVISIILIMIFLTKTAGYNSKRKKYNKKAEKLDTVYSVVWGMPMAAWTGIACTLMGLAVVSLVIMLIAKKKCNDAEEEYEERFEEYQRNKAEFADRRREEEYMRRREEDNMRREEESRRRDEDMQMMFMRMFGGAQGATVGAGNGAPSEGFAGGGYGLGAEQIRGIVSETMTAMLPGMQQMLPQQASVNNELVEKLLEKSEKNEETIEKLLKKIAEQPAERVIEKEVASSSVNDEAIKSLIEGQRIIMEKLASQSSQPQIIEKEVPVEKIVEKVVEVPVEVEKVVEKEVVKEVPVEVEKIVEKEVRVEVPVEVEKIVEKEVVKEVKVEVPAKAVAKPKKEIAPRLTLDEAYALLTKEQKKYFDGLREYALTKYKCKEKKSTYFVVYGQTTTNPLLKLTVKKDTTVALLKMEDEYMKDLRRDATGDGTKVKVKETEVLVSDAQAYETAKKMVDLRYDQIERYQDLLREQRAMKK